MTAPPRTTAQLTRLAAELPARYTAPLAHLARARVLTGAQLDQLFASQSDNQASADTISRVRRRIMTRLHTLGLVTTTARRVGGVRAGSAGHVYLLTSTGYRYLTIHNRQKAPSRVRPARAPGAAFLRHALAISDLYVQLVIASLSGSYRLSRFDTEPATWWPAEHGTWLRPDAYTLLHASAHADSWWIEVDNATENLPRIRSKIATYHRFFIHAGTGPDHVPPRVLFTAPDTIRAAAIGKAIARESTTDDLFILATTHAGAAELMISELRQP